jgi:hypothetical protein
MQVGARPMSLTFHSRDRMTILDLFKATLVCGGIGFLTCTYALVGQILVVGILGLFWLAYAQQAIRRFRGPSR